MHSKEILKSSTPMCMSEEHKSHQYVLLMFDGIKGIFINQTIRDRLSLEANKRKIKLAENAICGVLFETHFSLPNRCWQTSIKIRVHWQVFKNNLWRYLTSHTTSLSYLFHENYHVHPTRSHCIHYPVQALWPFMKRKFHYLINISHLLLPHKYY